MGRLSEADADPNSVFTRAFLPLLRADLPLLDAIKLSQERVFALARSADHDQTLAYYDEVRGRACECKAANAPLPAAPDDAFAAIIDAQTNPDTLEGMIAKLPEGFLKKRAKLAALRKSKDANLSARLPFARLRKRPRREATNCPRARTSFRSSIILRRSISSCLATRLAHRIGRRGQVNKALGRGKRPSAAHVRRAWQQRILGCVLAGMMAEILREGRLGVVSNR